MRLTVASLYTLPLVVLKSSESASDANRTAKIKVPQYFTRRILPCFVSPRQRQNDIRGRNDRRENIHDRGECFSWRASPLGDCRRGPPNTSRRTRFAPWLVLQNQPKR